jgi:hypothetical protein
MHRAREESEAASGVSSVVAEGVEDPQRVRREVVGLMLLLALAI